MNSVLVARQTQTKINFIKWHDGYSVGINELDQQHRMVILMINELSDALGRGQPQEDLDKLLAGLLKFTLEHFSTEEDLFDTYAYPWALTHKADHTAFKQNLTTFIQAYRQGKTELTVQFLIYCCDWLKQHIISRDKTYGYFFCAKGLK